VLFKISVANALIKTLTLPDAGPNIRFYTLTEGEKSTKTVGTVLQKTLSSRLQNNGNLPYSLFFSIILLVMQVNEDLYGLACLSSYPSDPWLGRVGRGRQPYMGTSRLLTPPKPARKGDPVQS
jgi:hypothetical protein